MIYRWKYRQNKSVGKVLAGIFFDAFSSFVRPSVFCFLPTNAAMEMGITDDYYSERRIPSENFLPINCVSYTDKINPSVKLFNGVVFSE